MRTGVEMKGRVVELMELRRGRGLRIKERNNVMNDDAEKGKQFHVFRLSSPYGLSAVSIQGPF